jgi:tetratricopeptide (TPR) repeat protein
VNRYYKPQDDTYIELRGQLAWILCNTGDFERARKMAEEGLPLMNESTPPRFRLDFLGAGALAEMHCGQYDKAIDLYKKQIELSKQIDPRQGLQYKGSLAKCLFAAKRYKEAEPILVEVLKNLDPTSYTGRSTYKVMFADYLELLRSTGRAAEAQQVEAAGKV